MNATLTNMRAAGCGLGLLVGAACAPSSLVDVQIPNSVADPSLVTSAAGATQMYNFAVSRWADMLGGDNFATGGGTGSLGSSTAYINLSGIFTDELMSVKGGWAGFDGTDDRSAFYSGLTAKLQSARVFAEQAREMLRVYGTTTPPAWQSRMLSAEGYVILYLAEMYCSGVPLSTIPLTSGTPTYTRGFTTQELLEHAAVLFDSALTLAGDSTRFASLAKVGKGRALLGLGRFADAATAVANVPTDYVFLLELGTAMGSSNMLGSKPQGFQVRDNEGGNGLVWSADPRAAIVTTPSISGGLLIPGKYAITGGVINALVAAPNTPVRAADGLEARLIEAEAALSATDPGWLAKLNTLRSACVGTAACAPVPGLTATALPPLTDPGTANARLDMVMRERAMWLYLTGHRQGDLRRLVHVYQRDPATLWPAGLYINPGAPPLVAPADRNGTVNYTPLYIATMTSESPVNPYYTGCTDLNP